MKPRIGVVVQIGLHHTCEYAYLVEENWKELLPKQHFLFRVPGHIAKKYDSWRVIGVDDTKQNVITLTENYPGIDFIQRDIKSGPDLSEVIKHFDLDRIDVLCMDIEGDEYNLLKTYDWKIQPEFIQVECHRWFHDETDTVEWYARKIVDNIFFSNGYICSRVLPTNINVKYPTAELQYMKPVPVTKAYEDKKYRIHFLGLAHTITNETFNACAFTGKILRACEWFTDNGHTVFHYGYPGATVKCTQHIDITSEEFFYKHNPNYKKKSTHNSIYVAHDKAEWTSTYHLEMMAKLRQIYEPGDIVMLNYGTYNGIYYAWLKGIDVIPIEMSIGYTGSTGDYKIWETHQIQDFTKGQWDKDYQIFWRDNPNAQHHEVPHGAIGALEPQWTDDVIYPFLDPNQFEYSTDNDGYHLYLGRIIRTKGIELACRATEAIGEKIVIAGQGDFEQMLGFPVPKHATFVGHADVEKRKKLMAGAKALWCPTWYVEPCGHIFIEAALSGKPIIGTDWGGPSKLILNEKTGYIVRSYSEAVYAAQHVDRINPAHCRKWGMNFTPKQMMPRYVSYLDRITAQRQGQDPLYYEHPVRDLSHRTLIHPDDPDYDINLDPTGIIDRGIEGKSGKKGK